MIPQLSELTIRDFRSIKGELVIPLDAQIVLIHGPNGAGKTSVVSALELALTGDVAGLRRNDANVQRHLVNRDASSASITLKAAGLARPAAAFELHPGRIKGTALLDPAQRAFYVERCYLSQSTLGRLLDIYQSPASRDQSNTPLTRFVKDLLGLDQLEALIDGLHPAGHKRRMFKLTPRLEQVERIDGDLAAAATQASLANRSRRARSDVLNTEWSVYQNRLNLSPDLNEAAQALRDDPDREKVSLIEQILREAVSLRTHWESLEDPGDSRARIEAAEAESARALAMYDAGAGRQLAEAINSLREQFPDLPDPADGDPSAAWSEANSRVEREVSRLDASLNAAKAAANKVEQIDQNTRQLQARMIVIEGRMADYAEETAGLGQALATVLPHVHTENCPVCDRDYSEVTGDTLASHVRAKIARLVEQAEQVQSLGTERQAAQQQLAQIERERGIYAGRMLEATAQTLLQQQIAALRRAQALLADSRSGAAQGGAIRRTHAEASGRAARLRLHESSAREIRDQLKTLCERISTAPIADTETTPAALSRVIAGLEAEQAQLAARRDDRATAMAVVDELLSLAAEDRESVAETQRRKGNRDAISAAQREIKTIRDEANVLRAAAEDARGAIVSRVFNKRLNAIWRDLFVRLAPNEPFVPAFTLPEDPKAPVNAMLETVHRDGGRYGRPGAMLSAGNLNTAALTLFIALHLSVKPPFPWLVLDDPVQSMDEMHIAQFAALLRTLAKVEGRQVIVAVHERPLFDYLALELSPAFPEDRLITVELGRTPAGTTRYDPQIIPFEPDRLVA